MAKNALRLGDTYTALRYYEEWSTRKPEQVALAFQVAELHRLTRNYREAEEAYAQVMKLDIADYPLSVFYLAQMQMSQAKYVDGEQNGLATRLANGVFVSLSLKPADCFPGIALDYSVQKNMIWLVNKLFQARLL